MCYCVFSISKTPRAYNTRGNKCGRNSTLKCANKLHSAVHCTLHIANERERPFTQTPSTKGRRRKDDDGDGDGDVDFVCVTFLYIRCTERTPEKAFALRFRLHINCAKTGAARGGVFCGHYDSYTTLAEFYEYSVQAKANTRVREELMRVCASHHRYCGTIIEVSVCVVCGWGCLNDVRMAAVMEFSVAGWIGASQSIINTLRAIRGRRRCVGKSTLMKERARFSNETAAGGDVRLFR